MPDPATPRMLAVLSSRCLPTFLDAQRRSIKLAICLVPFISPEKSWDHFAPDYGAKWSQLNRAVDFGQS